MKHTFLLGMLFVAFSSSYAQLPAAPPKRAHHELVYDEANKIVMMTSGSTPVNNGNSGIFFNDLWSFNGKQWSLLGNAGDKRSGMRLAYDSKRNKIFSFGGFSEEGALADLRVLEGNEWKTVSYLYEMRAAEAGFVYDSGRDKLIVFGGSPARGKVNAGTWEWDGSTWKKFEGSAPGGRQAFAMIYDTKRKKTVLYGGMDGDGKKFDDGIWEFDGAKWENIKTNESGPGSRMAPGYTYDSRRGLFIIFSGRPGEPAKNDTWGWNGKEWKQLSDQGPAARAMGYMSYDAARDRVVLFGGRLGWPNDAGDTWEWDGNSWSEIKYPVAE